MDINNDLFTTHLRRALNHLYEPDQLRLSPLVALFGLAGRVDSSSALQQILLQAIEDIRPEAQESQQSQGSMMYEVLFFRYVRGYAREAVANQLGISDRQLSREQRTAIETLAQLLWKTYHLDNTQTTLPELPTDTGKDLESDSTSTPWVEDIPSEDPSSWKLTINSLLELLQPLLRANNVVLRCETWDTLPDLFVPHVTLRHSLLTILGWMIPLAHHAELILTPTTEGKKLILTLQLPGQHFAGQPFDSGIDMARQLLERVNGSLEMSENSLPLEIKLTLPALDQIPVLLVEDNADTIQLFQRYVQGSRYSIMGLQDPTEALRQVERINPQIILIDVMMPQLDGWDLLTQLRMNGLVQNTIILICSILPQEGLARSLGADGFIQKPILPQDFLKALDRQMEQHAQESKSS
jgi:CheY-like chemotaxis protein